MTSTAPLDDGMPRRRSLGSPLDVELMNPEPQVQVHCPPGMSRPASWYNPLHDEEQVVPPRHVPVQKEEEPVQTIIRQIMKDTETTDRYAKYVNRKSNEELDKLEPTDN